MAFYYNPQAGYLATALRLSSTVVPSVFRRGVFWAFFALHLLVFAAKRSGYIVINEEQNLWAHLNWKDVQVITALTTFFEVFYSNQCYIRYLHLYNTTRKMLGSLLDFCYAMRIHIGKTSRAHVRLSTRYLMCSILLFFYEMNGTVSELEWQALTERQLIEPEEQEFIQAITEGKHRSLIVLHWCTEVVMEGWKETHAPNNVIKDMVARVLQVRRCQQDVVDTVNLPVPFQYFHLLNLMIVVNLLLWAYGMGITESVFAPVVYFFASLIFMGLLELATELSDPFGLDPCDFPMEEWMTELWSTVVQLIEYEYPGAEDGWREALGKQEPLLFQNNMSVQVRGLIQDDDRKL